MKGILLKGGVVALVLVAVSLGSVLWFVKGDLKTASEKVTKLTSEVDALNKDNQSKDIEINSLIEANAKFEGDYRRSEIIVTELNKTLDQLRNQVLDLTETLDGVSDDEAVDWKETIVPDSIINYLN